MALIGPPDPRRRREYSKEIWYARALRGKNVVSIWPAYKRQRTAAQYENEHKFADLSKQIAQAVPGAVDVSADYAKAFKMRVNDWKIALASGTLLYWDDQDGRTCTGVAWRDMMTHLLDVVCPGLGTPLIRYDIGWTSISAGQIGDKLIATENGPSWGGDIARWEMAEDTTAAKALSRSLDTLGGLPGAIAYRGPDRWTTLDIGEPGDFLEVGPDLLPRWANSNTSSPVVTIGDGAATVTTNRSSLTDTLALPANNKPVFVIYKGSSGLQATITDSRGGAWSLLKIVTGGAAAAALYMRTSGQALDTGDTVTATISSSVSHWGFQTITIDGATSLGTQSKTAIYNDGTLNGIKVGPTDNGSPGIFITLLARGNGDSGTPWDGFGDFNFVGINPTLAQFLLFGWEYNDTHGVSAAAVSNPANINNMVAEIVDLI